MDSKLVGILYIVGILAGIVALRRPKKDKYTCAGCRKKFQHNDRTVASHQYGALKFYCDDCNEAKSGDEKPKETLQLLE
jgi:predicted SprT family Zn-dependent metalloprotease